jgi:Tol biopolymer transport system component
MDRDGSNQHRLTYSDRDNTDPAWSADGRQIAFNSERDGNSEIYIMRADGSRQTRVTQRPEHEERPTWSQDGKFLAFGRYGEDGTGWVVILELESGSERRLSQGAYYREVRPHWSPDGEWLAVQRR